jgi:hypothetical protein
VNSLARRRQLESLLNELLSGIQEVLQSGEILSDEFQGLIAQELEQLTNEIDQINTEIGQENEQSNTSNPPAPNMPVPSGADLLWILSGGQPDAFINYARTFPDAALNALANNPGQLANVLDHLERLMPQGERGSADGIDQAPLDSSNIYGFQYDPQSGALKVRFQSGAVYGYQGVPKQIYQIFANGAVPAKTEGQNEHGRWWVGKNPSLGAAFSALIRQGGYSYQRLK